MQRGAEATANIIGFFDRGPGTTIAFRLTSGRWLVASRPHLEGAYFTCTPTGHKPCTGAGVFSLSY